MTYQLQLDLRPLPPRTVLVSEIPARCCSRKLHVGRAATGPYGDCDKCETFYWLRVCW